MIAKTTLAEITTTEEFIENTPYGDYPVKARKVERVVRFEEGQYAGKMFLEVDFYRNGQRMPGYCDGNQAKVAAVLERAAA